MMIAVAILGMLMGLFVELHRIMELGKEYKARSRRHWLELVHYDTFYEPTAVLTPEELRFLAHEAAMRRYHSSLSRKYALAASHPWLSVEPDLPPPAP
jgi:hypothetical protein